MDQSILFRKLNDISATIELPEGSIIFQAGDSAEGLYLIRSGRVALHWRIEPNVFLRESVGSGEIIGLAAALNGSYDATAQLTEDANLGYVALNAINKLEDCCPAVSRAITELIAYKVICRRIPRGLVVTSQPSRLCSRSSSPITFRSTPLRLGVVRTSSALSGADGAVEFSRVKVAIATVVG